MGAPISTFSPGRWLPTAPMAPLPPSLDISAGAAAQDTKGRVLLRDAEAHGVPQGSDANHAEGLLTWAEQECWLNPCTFQPQVLAGAPRTMPELGQG